MKQVTIHSDRYPGLSAPVPEAPGTDKPSSFTFAADIAYEVSDATAAALAALLESFDPRIGKHYRLSIADLSPAVETAPATADAIAPSEPVETVELVLTDEDQELIDVEVAKLKGLTVAQSLPIVQNTATNEELPVALRRAYLNAVIASRNAKAIDAKASELLELLS